MPEHLLGPAAAMTDRDAPVDVPSVRPALRAQETLLGLLLRDVVVRDVREVASRGRRRLDDPDGHVRYAPSTSSILWPGASVTTAFFQSERRPSARPIRFSFPSNEAVRTEVTLTLNTLSTAARISTLLASGRTRKATVFISSFCRMLFSVISGRIRISRAVRLIGAGSSRPAQTAGGLPWVLVTSFRQRLLERHEAGALEYHPMGVQELIDGHVRRRLAGQPRPVARGARQPPGQLAHHQQRRHLRDPERGQRPDQRLGLAVAGVDRLDRRELAGRDLGRNRGAQRRPSHLPRHILGVAPRCRAERLAAALPLHRAGRALPGAAGPFLLPRLAAAARHLAAPTGIVRAGPSVGELSRHRLMEQRRADLRAKHVRLQLERSGLLSLRVQNLHGWHRYFFSATFCCACCLVAFTDLRSMTSDPLAPGTAPRTRTMLCSAI